MDKRYRSVLELAQQNSTSEFADQLKMYLQGRTISRALFVLRNQEGVTQVDLAQRMGCPQSQVSKLEHAADSALRIGDLERYLTSLGYSLELRVMPKANLVNRIKCSVLQIKEQLDHLAELAQKDQAIRKGVGRFFSEYIANVMGLFADSASRLIRSRRLRPEQQYALVAQVFEGTEKLFESSGALLPEEAAGSYSRITVCGRVEEAPADAGPRSGEPSTQRQAVSV